MRPVKYVAQVKRESSKFVKTLGTHYHQFYWQRCDLTFQDEYRAMLRRYGIECCERYVWD